MSLTDDEKELLEIGKSAIPEVFRSDQRTQEDLVIMAKCAGAAKRVGQHWLDMCFIGKATGPEATEYVDWLEFHAQDQGTHRQNGESTDALRNRLWSSPYAVLRNEILGAAQKIVDQSGVTGSVAMLEMPRDASHFGSYSADSGTGGEFVKDGDTVFFRPSVKFAYPPYFYEISGLVKSTSITFSGAASSGNNGTFAVTGLYLNWVKFTNASGVGGTSTEDDTIADASVTWSTSRYNRKDVELEGWPRAFSSRGYRSWRGAKIGTQDSRGSTCGFILILPYGCSEATQRSVTEMCRQSKAAGFLAIVERCTES